MRFVNYALGVQIPPPAPNVWLAEFGKIEGVTPRSPFFHMAALMLFGNIGDHYRKQCKRKRVREEKHKIVNSSQAQAVKNRTAHLQTK